MKKEELRAELMKGKTLEEVLYFKEGQDCVIFKAEQFVPGDEVLYVPDIDLNQIPTAVDLSKENSMMDAGGGWGPMTSAEQITVVLSYCYTGEDFVAECEGNEQKARELFCYCDWQHPCSAYPEICDEEEWP